MKFARFAMPVIALFAIAASAAADTTPVRYLMTVEGINPTIPFQVQSLSWGISNPSTFSAGGGGLTAGRPSLSSFNIMKYFDSNDPALINACFLGMHIDHAELKAYRGTNTVPFLDILLEDVMVESHQMSASVNTMPLSSLSLAFVKLTINGVVLDQSTLALDPAQLNNMLASIIQKASATPAKPAAHSRVTVH